MRIFLDVVLVNCLWAVASLTELTLIEVGITNEIFCLLDPCHSSYPSPSSLLPTVETFRYSGGLFLDFSAIANLLRSRWEAGEGSFDDHRRARLQSVEIETDAA